MSDSRALLRLFQLVSPALPIGGYNFSQGLEYAVHADWMRDEASALAWIRGLAKHALGALDVPVLLRLHEAWSRQDQEAVERWNAFLLAARETSELRAEDKHLGRALAKVLADLKVEGAAAWVQRGDLKLEGAALGAQGANASFAASFALAAAGWGITAHEAACGYLWAWAENQVLAAVKIVPLGQSAGQRMLDALIQDIPAIATAAAELTDDDIGSAAPLHLIACAAHETQYTRLFHS
jgi:urease accessory protein